MNKSDSERVKTVIEGMGFSYTEDENKAVLLGVLSCSVRQKSIDKVYGKIHQWNKRKAKQPIVTFVSGCILPADKEKFLTLFDMIFSMDELPEFPDMLRQYGIVTPYSLSGNSNDTREEKRNTTPFPVKDEIDLSRLIINKQVIQQQDIEIKHPQDKDKILGFWDIKPDYQSEFEAYIPIQNGCDKFCTFCAVPYTRGREVSRPSKEILNEVKLLVEKGYKSITLLGQNVNSYGLDKKGKEISFAGLLKQIGELGSRYNHNFWVYFTSPHPRDMTKEVIDVIAEYPVLAKQIHLPLQSGDDKVLIRMNRKHSLKKYREIVEYIRYKIPQATLFTDIIAGFTGETDDQFQRTLDAFKEFRFNMAYIAKYSPRPGATSARWEDDVPHEIKKERLHLLTEELKIHSSEWNKRYVGKFITVLVIGYDKKGKYLRGLTEGRVNIRFPSENRNLTGSFVNLFVESTSDFSLEGKWIEEKHKVLSE